MAQSPRRQISIPTRKTAETVLQSRRGEHTTWPFSVQHIQVGRSFDMA